MFFFSEILQFESGNADAIYVRGMCLYYQDNQDSAFNHFQHVLRLAPDHQRAKDVYKVILNLYCQPHLNRKIYILFQNNFDSKKI